MGRCHHRRTAGGGGSDGAGQMLGILHSTFVAFNSNPRHTDPA